MATFTKQILGQDVTIGVDEESTGFSAHIGTDYARDTDLAKLLTKVKGLVQKQRVKANVLVGLGNGRNIKLTTRSLKDRNEILAKSEDGTAADSVRAYTTAYEPWTEETRAQLAALKKASSDASDALEAFLHLHEVKRLRKSGKYASSVDVEDVLEDALKAKLKAAADSVAAQTSPAEPVVTPPSPLESSADAAGEWDVDARMAEVAMASPLPTDDEEL